MNKYYRILSLDGGGIRGLLTAVWLCELEDRLGDPIRNHFDLIAGTSTGSILACAVASGIPALTIVDLYTKRGTEIFPKDEEQDTDPDTTGEWIRYGAISFLKWVERHLAPRYDGIGLEKVLKDTVKESRFGDLPVPTLVTSYNTHTRSAHIFKSFKERHKQLPLWEVCRASSAAPAYFPAHMSKSEDEIHPLIDGGIVANNPSAIAIAEALRLNREKGLELRHFLLASFGTGEYSCSVTGENIRTWGAFQWLKGPPEQAIIDILMDGSVDATEYLVRQLIPKEQLFRFQTKLDASESSMDDVDPSNLGRLKTAARNYLRGEGGGIMDRLVERLQEGVSPGDDTAKTPN